MVRGKEGGGRGGFRGLCFEKLGTVSHDERSKGGQRRAWQKWAGTEGALLGREDGNVFKSLTRKVVLVK